MKKILTTVLLSTMFLPLISSAAVNCVTQGDANGDQIVNSADIQILNAAYNTKLGDVNYNPQADFNSDGFVDLTDLSIVSGNINHPICPAPVSVPITTSNPGFMGSSSYCIPFYGGKVTGCWKEIQEIIKLLNS